MKKILINASNLHSGGGVQVAASFIYELSNLGGMVDIENISIVCSDSVKLSLSPLIDMSVFHQFNIVNIHGFSKPKSNEKKLFTGFEVCFSIFGPVYFDIKVKRHICGFAQAWIAYPDNQVYEVLSWKNKLIYKAKFFVQKNCFKCYDMLVVEAYHVKKALLNIGFDNNIEVVSNTISSVFEINSTTSSKLIVSKEKLLIGFIGRAYLHKNIKILKKVHQLLEGKYKFSCDFIFTLNESEMKECGFYDVAGFKTVGEITLNQCPSFYQQIDAFIFPSLLECFSAAPIEAMQMSVPVFASDRLFVKDFCKDAAFYFDPINADDIAKTIYTAFNNPKLMQEKVHLGKSLVAELPSAKERAESYIRLILE